MTSPSQATHKTYLLPLGANPSNVVWDATYYCGAKPTNTNRVHLGDPRYPGGIERWKQHWQPVCGEPDCHIDCGDAWANGHNLTCYRIDFKCEVVLTACGPGGICGGTTLLCR